MTAEPDDTTADLVLNEQRGLVGTEWVPRERLSVRRRIVTETRQIEVTVRREELLIDRAPVEDAPAVIDVESPASGSPPPLVVVLHEEVPVVGLQVRPYERVTIGVERVRTDELVTSELSREQAEAVVDQRPRR